MYAIKWTSNNTITKHKASGLILNKYLSGSPMMVIYDTLEKAEAEITNLKKNASSTISFEAIKVECKQL